MNKYGFFWKTMELCAWDNEGNDMLVLEPVIDYLSKKPDIPICSFWWSAVLFFISFLTAGYGKFLAA